MFIVCLQILCKNTLQIQHVYERDAIREDQAIQKYMILAPILNHFIMLKASYPEISVPV